MKRTERKNDLKNEYASVNVNTNVNSKVIWEYDIIIVRANTETLKEIMNEYGKEGWEIFSCNMVGKICGHPNGGILYNYQLMMRKIVEY